MKLQWCSAKITPKPQFLIIYNSHLSNLLWHDKAKGRPTVRSHRQTRGRKKNWKSVVNEVRGEEKKGAGSKPTSACRNLSPGQIGEQGLHCGLTAPDVLLGQMTPNQICVIFFDCEGKRGSFHQRDRDKKHLTIRYSSADFYSSYSHDRLSTHTNSPWQSTHWPLLAMKYYH